MKTQLEKAFNMFNIIKKYTDGKGFTKNKKCSGKCNDKCKNRTSDNCKCTLHS